MPQWDLPREQLENYRPDIECPPDLTAFWQTTLAETREFPLTPVFTPYDAGLPGIEVWDTTFNGFGGEAIKAWLIFPRSSAGPGPLGSPLPCVVEFIGYGGGRGFPHQWLFWPAAGWATLVMDTRGQGSEWLHGDTPDREPAGSSPQVPGFFTRGILDPATYYYRRLFTDAVRAAETAARHERVDPSRIFLTGISQGGGVALAASALCGRFPVPGAPLPGPAGVMADVPGPAHFRRLAEIASTTPATEIVAFLKNHRHREAAVFRTLSYFDLANLVPWSRQPALYSVALMDVVCPPSTVYACFNAHGSAAELKAVKEMAVYPFNGHEGGQQHHALRKLAWCRSVH